MGHPLKWATLFLIQIYIKLLVLYILIIFLL